MTGLERTLKAFANKRRIAIVKYLLSHSSAPVGEIADAIKLSFRSTSKHLGLLIAAEVVENEQRGKQIYYRLMASPSRAIRTLLNLV